MRPNPAIASLYSNRGKTALSLAGIAFAVLLIFMQLGFLGGVADTATVIYNRMDYDILVRSPDYLHLMEARTIPRDVLRDIESMPGVASVRPMSISISGWLTPPTEFLPERDLRGIVLIGIDPQQPVFDLAEINDQAHKLTESGTALIDSLTTADYGPFDGERFGDLDVQNQVETELAYRRTRLVGHFAMGTGLAANGSVVVSDTAYSKLTGIDTRQAVTFGLVKLESGADLNQLHAQLNKEVAQRWPSGGPIDVLTRDQVNDREVRRWIWSTPIGLIFMMGVVVAIIVGGTIVYMVLSSDIAKRIHELATLKAMGYSNNYLARSVMLQALILAVLAFFPALAAALGAYELTYRLSNIPITMTWTRVGLVFVVTIGMCAVSGLLALRKVWQAEPASLF